MLLDDCVIQKVRPWCASVMYESTLILIVNVESAVHSEPHASPQSCETSLVIVLVCNEAYPSVRLIKHDACAPPFTPSLHTLLWCLYYDTPAAPSILKWTMIVGHMSTAVEFCCVYTVCPVYTHLVVGLIFSSLNLCNSAGSSLVVM